MLAVTTLGPDIGDHAPTRGSETQLANMTDASSWDDIVAKSAGKLEQPATPCSASDAEKPTSKSPKILELIRSAFHKQTDTDHRLEDTSPPKETTSVPPHITLDGTTKVAPLEHYIMLAEQACFQAAAPTRRNVFRENPHGQAPTLRSDRENRILVYPGCFNPPHLGHTGLLWHTYLCMDDKTIAAIVLPMSTTVLSNKRMTSYNGRQIALTLHQRTQLWQDPVLSRFVWVFPEDSRLIGRFYAELKEVCRQDGFRVSFPSLRGGDHFEGFRQRGYMGRGNGDIVTSDVGRPVDFVRGAYDEVMLPHCNKWKKLVSNAGRHIGELWNCKDCWPCRKLRVVYPEMFEQELDFVETTSGDMVSILQGCVDTQGVVWSAKLRNHDCGYMFFIPGNRRYQQHPMEDSDDRYEEEASDCWTDPPLSSTQVRKDILYGLRCSKEDLQSTVINGDLLAMYVGVDVT